MNHATLEQKLTTLKEFKTLRPETVDKVGQLIRELDDWSLFRMNPVAWAGQYGFDAQELLDVFIHAAKLGLLDFNYNMICPQCGGVEYSHNSMNDVEKEKFFCVVCNVEVPSQLDDQVEVSFTLNSAIRALNLDPFKDPDHYRRYYFSANFRRSQQLTDYVQSSIRAFQTVSPDRSESFRLEVAPGELYRVISPDQHSAVFVHGAKPGEDSQQNAEIDVVRGGFSPRGVVVTPGVATISVRNLTKQRVSYMVVRTEFDQLHKIITAHPSHCAPFVTGKALLNTQSFRDLFRIQELDRNLRLSLRSLTILFTDLKGSTELYDRTGDIVAYGFVQDHFQVLTQAVRENRGAIIKTMGDAIMATFSTPQDGVKAAVAMMSRMEAINQRVSQMGYETGLKIGLHEGPALAVNSDDRLDYFGQTVNVAARVQGLAAAGEIWVTTPVFSASGVPAMVHDAGYHERRQSVSLKGVGAAAEVYRLTHGAQA
ncbi:MAG: DUF5939 domain-containing protein [Myxococcota bacterium]